jgi:hypothetical protein
MLDDTTRNAYRLAFESTAAAEVILGDLAAFAAQRPDPLIKLGALEMLEHLRKRVREARQPARDIEPAKLD